MCFASIMLPRQQGVGIRRILHCTRFFYLDSSNGASVANLALMECLHRNDFAVEALCGPIVNALPAIDQAGPLGDHDSLSPSHRADFSEVWMIGTPGVRVDDPHHLKMTVGGVPITTLRRKLRRDTPIDLAEAAEFLSLLDDTLNRFQPDVLVTYGGDALTLEILARARHCGVVTIFTLHNFGYPDPDHFSDVDALLVPSRFSAEHHRRALEESRQWNFDVIEPQYVEFFRDVRPR